MSKSTESRLKMAKLIRFKRLARFGHPLFARKIGGKADFFDDPDTLYWFCGSDVVFTAVEWWEMMSALGPNRKRFIYLPCDTLMCPMQDNVCPCKRPGYES